MNFIDFFSGAGMFRKGMELAGHKCIGYVEINKYARLTYETNYETKNEWTELDITKVNYKNIPKADIWCLGFPCKNMSTANLITRNGLKGEQSGLFLNICDLLYKVETKPKYLFIENVKGFTTINGGLDFLEALCIISELGYDIFYEVSSALKYNVPQNRIRTYLICEYKNSKIEKNIENINVLKNISINNYNIFDLMDFIKERNLKIKINYGTNGIIKNGVCKILEKEENKNQINLKLKDVLEEKVEESYFLTEEQLNKIKKMKSAKEKTLKDGSIWKEGNMPFPDDINKYSRCITPSDNSLNRSTHVILDKGKYRKLTIRERARLQGLSDDFVFPVSNSQASLQIGNGVAVNAIKELAKKYIK